MKKEERGREREKDEWEGERAEDGKKEKAKEAKE